jgi:phosphoenolpyruvate phosphomutase
MSKTTDLHRALNSKPILRVGGAFDALSAKLVETAGFDAIWAGSFAISATHALPDASILTMTEFLNVTSNMVDSCKIPVIADCDTGFGGPGNVDHMIRKYENAGVAGVSIEDKTFPKQNSLLENGTQELLSEKDFVAKMIAAKNAKQDDDFLIIARTEALIANLGMDEALKRARAYENAGADAILIHSKKNTPDEILEFSDKWDGDSPIIIVPTTYPGVTIDELIQHNIKMVIYANQTLRASHLHMSKILSELINTKSINEITSEMSSMEDIFRLQEMFEMKNQEEKIRQIQEKMGYI